MSFGGFASYAVFVKMRSVFIWSETGLFI